MNVMDRRVLVLNKSWVPINTISVADAITKICSDRAKILGPDYTQYTLDEWVDAKIAAKDMVYISSVNFSVAVPEIILNLHYNGFVNKKPKLSRRAITARDKVCQYCGKLDKEMNRDHVIPQSKGGRTTWTNIVYCCYKCNQKKGDLTPKQAGMELLKEPIVPHWWGVSSTPHSSLPTSWEAFLGKMYYEVELEE